LSAGGESRLGLLRVQAPDLHVRDRDATGDAVDRARKDNAHGEQAHQDGENGNAGDLGHSPDQAKPIPACRG
jgi:hypothetical protein